MVDPINEALNQLSNLIPASGKPNLSLLKMLSTKQIMLQQYEKQLQIYLQQENQIVKKLAIQLQKKTEQNKSMEEEIKNNLRDEFDEYYDLKEKHEKLIQDNDDEQQSIKKLQDENQQIQGEILTLLDKQYYKLQQEQNLQDFTQKSNYIKQCIEAQKKEIQDIENKISTIQEKCENFPKFETFSADKIDSLNKKFQVLKEKYDKQVIQNQQLQNLLEQINTEKNIKINEMQILKKFQNIKQDNNFNIQGNSIEQLKYQNQQKQLQIIEKEQYIEQLQKKIIEIEEYLANLIQKREPLI